MIFKLLKKSSKISKCKGTLHPKMWQMWPHNVIYNQVVELEWK